MTEPEFRALLDRYLNGKASPDERELLDRFFDSYHNRADVSGLNADIKSEIREEILNHVRGKKQSEIKIVPIQRSHTWLKVAAAVSLTLVATYLLFTRLNAPAHETLAIKTIEHTTTRGQKYDVELSDGTRIKLNSNSSISYPEKFNGNTREISLQGEAYFDVAHDAAKPFIVHTGTTSTRVLGTSFNVRADQHATTVTLVEGKVNVATPATDAVLLPNQQAVIRKGSEKISTSQVDVSRYTAWANNRLIFENVPLADAFVMLENWYNVDIEVDSDAIKKCVITGKYENESLENVLNSFSFMLKMEYTIDKHQVTVKGKGCN